jgi:hypothetical protein
MADDVHDPLRQGWRNPPSPRAWQRSRKPLAFLLFYLLGCCLTRCSWGSDARGAWTTKDVVIDRDTAVRFLYRSDDRYTGLVLTCGFDVLAQISRGRRRSNIVYYEGGFDDCGVSYAAQMLDDGRVLIRINFDFYVERNGELVSLDALGRTRANDVLASTVEAADAYTHELRIAAIQLSAIDRRRACQSLERAIVRWTTPREPDAYESLRAVVCGPTAWAP